MTLHSVRCIGMDEGEMEAAAGILGGNPLFERSGYQASGTASDEDIQELEKRGLIVEVMPDPAETSIGWLEPAETPDVLEAMSVAAPPPEPYATLARTVDEHYIIQFKAPLSESDKKELDALGVMLGAYVPDFANKARLSEQQRAAVEALGFVKRVVPFDLKLTLRRVTARKKKKPPDDRVVNLGLEAITPPPREVMYDVRCHDAGEIPAVHEVIAKDSRLRKVEAGRNRIRIWTTEGAQADALIADIGALPQVDSVDLFEYPVPLSQFARQAVGLEGPGQPAVLPWDGTGQLVGVADSGIDTQHPDLKPRLKKLIERVVPEAPDDPAGHGTHVCSIIAGDGTASGGVVKGIAPGAQLVVQSVRDENGDFSGFPVNLATLFQEAFDEDVRIHNNSWGSSGPGLWTVDDFELDQFVYEHPDFLIVVAAGNDGQQPNPLVPTDPLGRIGYSSISSPGASKNSLTVGACCSPRTDGPYQGKSWKHYQGRLPSPTFPPIADEPISGDANVLAAFSSRGPTDDERVKPDLVAPGTVILAAKSSPSTPRFPEPGFGGHYTYQSGTSMAAPVLAGSAAIARQYYVSERQHARPSAALLKATLINGCEWIALETVADQAIGEPNFHQGFGRFNARLALPVPGNADGFSLRFVDVYKDDAGALNSAKPVKASWKKRIQVKGGLPLRITLCWTDYPAHGLQNHLDLLVQSPMNVRAVGNPNMKRGPWAKTDRFNNVERLIIEEPAEGVWTLMVNAANTPYPSQGFSLVATGKELSEFF
jgi:subtilisin family serine protease